MASMLPPSAVWFYCRCHTCCTSRQGSALITTCTFSQATVTTAYFPREVVNSFTALERNVAPEHNLLLTALPTFLLVIFLGKLREVGVTSLLQCYALPLAERVQRESSNLLHRRAQKGSSVSWSPMSPLELSLSRLGAITPESQFQHLHMCAYITCQPKCTAFQKGRGVSPAILLVYTQPWPSKTYADYEAHPAKITLFWAVLRYQMLHLSGLLMWFRQRNYCAHSFLWESWV